MPIKSRCAILRLGLIQRVLQLEAASSKKLFPHVRQQKGFSHVCVRMCMVKLLLWENLFPHSWQQ